MYEISVLAFLFSINVCVGTRFYYTFLSTFVHASRLKQGKYVHTVHVLVEQVVLISHPKLDPSLL